ncbi:MAG: hypothetical protein J6Y25_02475 [Elusimicrobiaceae bacterium]|nr:hypothetical protein [Elusimicrobiaceae bacterium]
MRKILFAILLGLSLSPTATVEAFEEQTSITNIPGPIEDWMLLSRVQALHLGHYNFQLHVHYNNLSAHEQLIANHIRNHFIPLLEEIGQQLSQVPLEQQEKVASTFSQVYSEHIHQLATLLLKNQSQYPVLEIIDDRVVWKATDELVQKAIERGSFIIPLQELTKDPSAK